MTRQEIEELIKNCNSPELYTDLKGEIQKFCNANNNIQHDNLSINKALIVYARSYPTALEGGGGGPGLLSKCAQYEDSPEAKVKVGGACLMGAKDSEGRIFHGYKDLHGQARQVINAGLKAGVEGKDITPKQKGEILKKLRGEGDERLKEVEPQVNFRR